MNDLYSYLHKSMNNIKTKDDLVLFIKELREDFILNNDSWENVTIETYLESMAAWLNDTSDFKQRNLEASIFNEDTILIEPDHWKMLATILYVAKIYE